MRLNLYFQRTFCLSLQKLITLYFVIKFCRNKLLKRSFIVAYQKPSDIRTQIAFIQIGISFRTETIISISHIM